MKSKFNMMIALVLFVSAAWGVGWTYFSAKAEERVERMISRLNLQEERLRCDNRRAGGFPFRLVFSCDATSFQNSNAFSVQIAGFDAQAFVYRPLHQVVDFKSPANINVGNLGTLEVLWEKARLGSQVQTDGVLAATARIEDAHARFIDGPAELTKTTLRAQSTLLSTRRTTEEEQPNSLVLGVIAKKLQVEGDEYRLPAFDLEGSVIAHEIAPVLSGETKPLHLWIQKGGEADIQGVSLVSGASEVFVKGWVKLDLDGFWNADLDVDSTNLQGFIDAMGPEFAQFQTIAQTLIAAIEALGSKVTLSGKDAKRIRIKIRRGFVNVGFIPLGTIRQLDLSQFKSETE